MKGKREFIFGISCLLICCLVLFPAPYAAAGDTLNEIIQQQQQVLQQQNQAENQLKNLTTKADQMEKQIKTLTTQITEAEQDLNKKNVAYTQAVTALDQARQAVEDKQEELKGRQDALRKRSRSVYEDGESSYLEVFLQAASISDFLSRLEYLNCILDNDQTLLDEIRVEKADLEQKKADMEAKAAEAERLKKAAAEARIYLSSSKNQKESALEENQKDQNALMEQIEKLEADSKALESKIRELQKENTNGVTGTINTWPTPGCTYITSPFGIRKHPITGVVKQHTGVDIGAANKSKILAAGAGTVILAGWYGAYGNAVIIDHGNGISSLYGHLSSLNTSVGQIVAAGQIVGYEGTTGYSTGPHLHFEVRQDGTPVNPMTYF